jgi:mono/diheme cytochrome c family protein
VTEIPEHLLKRSKERRQALGLPSDAGDAAPAPAGEAPATPAVAATPAPAPPAPRPAKPAVPAAAPPPKPEPHYVRAYKRRRKIPIWAMPVLALLPLWLCIYWQAMQPPEVEVVGPLAAGAELYGACAGCHGADGGGVAGAGRQLNNGEVLLTFPTIEEMLTFIYVGNRGYAGVPYGDPDRPGGPHVGGQDFALGAMPAWGATAGGEFEDVEILEVVCHERYTLGGGDQTSEEFEQWCSEDGEQFLLVEEGGFEAAGVPTAPQAP